MSSRKNLSRKNDKQKNPKSRLNAIIFISLYVLLLFLAYLYYSNPTRIEKKRIGTLCLRSDTLDSV